MKQSPTFFAARERVYSARLDLMWNAVTISPARTAADDLRLARASGANVLLIGRDPEVSDAAADLAGSAASAGVTMWTADGPRGPSRAAHDAVVIARAVEGLRPNEQQNLLHWLTAAGGETRVISTASPSLWPMVVEGAFSAELYYRLNTVCIRLS
ncbi:MAG: hypothetical protein ACRD1V_13105 [Vicinamibacterales bacterium]